MANKDLNPFGRFSYSNNMLDSTNTSTTTPSNRQVFTGGDLIVYINNKRIDNLESCTWSSSVEVVGDYVMGDRNAQTYTTGKRVIVGTLVFKQYDRHALMEQVFDVSNKFQTQGDLWRAAENQNAGILLAGGTKVNFLSTSTTPLNRDGGSLARTSGSLSNGYSTRGLSVREFQTQLNDAAQTAAAIQAGFKINYTDQLPVFDLTLVGVNKSGAAATATIFGIQSTQETAGISSNDMSNSIGISFVALAVSPWRAINREGNSLSFPSFGSGS